ncbi:unnamed protein product [Heterosigma akashiwo]
MKLAVHRFVAGGVIYGSNPIRLPLARRFFSTYSLKEAYTNVIAEQRGKVGLITLNRPKVRRNWLSNG